MRQQQSSRSPTFCVTAETAVEQLEPGIRRQMLGFGPDLMMCRIWFEEGAVGRAHSHPHSQSSYVERGRFRVTIDGVERDLVAGDDFYVAPHLDHGAVCLEAGVVVDCFSPARADFLQVPT